MITAIPSIITVLGRPPRGRTRRLGHLTLAILLGGLLMPLVAIADNVRLGGTGSALGTMQRLVEAFTQSDPQFALSVLPNLGTTGGLKALTAGLID